MNIQVYYSEDYKLKSLKPICMDFSTSPKVSPLSVNSATAILIPSSCKMIVFAKASASQKVIIQPASNSYGESLIADGGSLAVNLQDGELCIPTQDLAGLIITSGETGAVTVNFTLLCESGTVVPTLPV